MTQRVDIIKADISHTGRIAKLEKNCIPGGWSEKLFEEALECPGSLMFAAIMDENVVGFMNGSYVLDEAELLNIAVCEKCRKNGIAGMLIERFEEELAGLNVDTVYLEVRESNTAARGLYEKYGYIQNGLRKNYYRNPDENAVLMVKKLDGN